MHKFCLILASLLLLLQLGFANEIFVVNSESRTLSRIDTATGSVNNAFAQLGLTPNRILVDGDLIYVVCSGANSIQCFSRLTGALEHTIFVASSANPWDVLKHGDYLYVTGYFTDKVYKISLDTYTVTGSVNVGTSPEGMAVYGNKLYVGNTGGYASGYANSSVSVVNLDTFQVTGTVPVWHNPQDLQVVGSELHVACTGNWASISGAIDIIDTTTDQRTDRLFIGGNPWSLWICSSGTGYVGEGYNNAVYSYNAITHQVLHSAENPLQPGAIAVHGNMDKLALLSANWGVSGTVLLRNADWEPLAQYTVGLLPTDLWLCPSDVATEDETLPVPSLSVYPNPVSKEGMIKIQTQATKPLTLRLFNIKGQLIGNHKFHQSDSSLDLKSMHLSPGIYLYQIDSYPPDKLLVY